MTDMQYMALKSLLLEACAMLDRMVCTCPRSQTAVIGYNQGCPVTEHAARARDAMRSPHLPFDLEK